MLNATEKAVLKTISSSKKAFNNLTTLCDEYGGRFAGSEENKAAANFILSLFEDYEFTDPHIESFSFQGCQVGDSSLEIKGLSKKIQTLTLPMTISGRVEGELVAIETKKDAISQNLDGKIVLGTNRLPLRSCVDAGAIGFVWMHPFKMMGPPTGVVPQLVPSASVKNEDGLFLKRLIDKKKFSVILETECEIFERESWNVCGEIKGTEGDEFVLLGGHYDGHEIAQAAFDCGAACIAVTEMGRILNSINEKLEGNVRIVCFSAEEFGFYGSKNYAERHINEMKDMRFTYQLDCNGGYKPQMVTVDYWPQLEPFYDKLRNDLSIKMPFDQRMGPGDSKAFHELGIPTGSIIDYRKPGRLPLLKTVRHTEYDTVDKISLRGLQNDTAIGAISTMRILVSGDWPNHRTKEEVEFLKRKLNF